MGKSSARSILSSRENGKLMKTSTRNTGASSRLSVSTQKPSTPTVLTTMKSSRRISSSCDGKNISSFPTTPFGTSTAHRLLASTTYVFKRARPPSKDTIITAVRRCTSPSRSATFRNTAPKSTSSGELSPFRGANILRFTLRPHGNFVDLQKPTLLQETQILYPHVSFCSYVSIQLMLFKFSVLPTSSTKFSVLLPLLHPLADRRWMFISEKLSVMGRYLIRRIRLNECKKNWNGIRE